MPNLSSGQRTLPADNQKSTILRKTWIRFRPHRRPSALRDRSRSRPRTVHHPRRNSRRDPEDQSRNRSNRSGPETPGYERPDPGKPPQPVSKTAIPRTRHRRSDEPVTLRVVHRTPLQQAKRGFEDHPAALEFQHRQSSELQGPLLHIEQRIPASRSGKAAGPANLLGGLRTQDAETHGGSSGRMDTALSHTTTHQMDLAIINASAPHGQPGP